MSKRVLPAALLSVALLAGVALRLWNLGQTSWQFDEIVYHQIATNVLQHGLLAEKIVYRQSYEPFLYQPPWYLHLLAGWFWLTRPTIYSARLLGVIFSTCSLAMIWLLMRRLAGARAACFAAIPLVFDGWLMYVQRVSYIENLTLMVIIAGFLLYQIGLDTSRTWYFAASGVVFGVAACLKYTGVYAILALAISWLIVRRDNGRHAIALGAAVGTLAVDQAYLVLRYGHAYLSETAVQIRRVIGLQKSGGSLTSPTALLHLLFAQYDIFAVSFVVSLAGLAIALTYLIRCYRARSWEPVQGHAVLFSWAAAGVMIFGLSSLRYPQYFALVLVPLYLLFWRTLIDNRRAWLKYACVTVAVAAGLVSYRLSTDRQQVNPYAKVAQYTAAHVPPGAVMIADEQIGDLLTQPFCREQQATPCLHHASYGITWDTYLQSTQKLGDPAFQSEFAGATPLYSATGFSGTATIWKLTPKPAVHGRPYHPVVGVDVAATSDYTTAQTQAYGARLMPYIRGTLHADAVSIVWDLCDPSFQSDLVQQCQQSLSPSDVAVLIRQATASHLRVQLRPLIRVGPPAGWNDAKRSWEGHIRPRNVTAWFVHLLAAEHPYLTLLRGVPASQIVTGTELEGITQGWTQFLASAQRACGTCSVTASAWHGDYAAGNLPPVSAVGVDWYPGLGLSSDASQAAVTRAWERSLATIPRQVLARTTLDEISIRATAGAYSAPSDWNKAGPSDQLVQARYFTAACQTARHYHMAGLYFYEIPLTDNPAQPSPFPALFVGTQGATAIARCNG